NAGRPPSPQLPSKPCWSGLCQARRPPPCPSRLPCTQQSCATRCFVTPCAPLPLGPTRSRHRHRHRASLASSLAGSGSPLLCLSSKRLWTLSCSRF
ncbi:hypothetical protein HK405_001583, partial [Cladochytrium tenue]